MSTMVNSLKEFGQIKLAAMLGTAMVLIAFFTFLALRISTPTLTPLYTNLPIEDGAQIVAELDARSIPYELRANGTQILVPANDVAKMRLMMAQQGLPSGGSVVGYEVFDSTETLGTSSFVLNVNKVRALEGELSRTIAAFNQVDSARVHLVLPKRELFSRDRSEPTASIALKLRSNGLGKEEIAAIRHLVATAVPGLEVKKITVVDSFGRLLARGGGEEGDMGMMAEETETYRIAYENRMQARIEELIEQSLGAGKVRVSVNAEMDFDRIVTNEESYDPEGQVARSIQGIESSEVSNETSASNTVSVANNLPSAAGGGDGDKAETQSTRTEEITNFEISKKITNHIKETGTVRRLSIAVLVDGNYAPVGEDGTQSYTPREEAELAQVETLIKTAMGYDETRGDTVSVVNMQFVSAFPEEAPAGPMDWMQNEANGIVQTLVLGGVAILAILLIIRPMVNRALENAGITMFDDDIEQESLLAPGSAAAMLTDQTQSFLSESSGEENLVEMEKVEGRVKSSSIVKLNGLVEQHPEEALDIIRQWTAKQG